MSSPIDRLQEVLSASLAKMASEEFAFSIKGIEDMRKTVDRIRKTVGDRPAVPNTDRICSALKKLREQGAASLDGMEFYFVCWGLAEACGNLPKLIDDEPNFIDMMNEVRLRKPGNLLWQGLLKAYFSYTPDPGTKGESNWLLLRAWLNNDIQALYNSISPTLRPALTWLTVLRTHQRLLGENPWRAYAEKALRGDRTEIDEIKGALNISESGWFWGQLILWQVDEATSWRDDARFKNALETLIAQLHDCALVRDEALKRLLTRYASCTDRRTHETLKRFALDRWKNSHSGGLWGNVEPDVRKMVQEWVALEDLRDFFSLVKDNPETDRLRLEFWSGYIGRMTRTHLVLGPDAWSNFSELRDRKRGRVSRLANPVKRSNNAFVMQIGDYFFVEFSVTGNAAYGYMATVIERLLNHSAIDRKDLANRGDAVFYEWHTPSFRWPQEKFAPKLRELGVTPDATKYYSGNYSNR